MSALRRFTVYGLRIISMKTEACHIPLERIWLIVLNGEPTISHPTDSHYDSFSPTISHSTISHSSISHPTISQTTVSHLTVSQTTRSHSDSFPLVNFPNWQISTTALSHQDTIPLRHYLARLISHSDTILHGQYPTQQFPTIQFSTKKVNSIFKHHTYLKSPLRGARNPAFT